MPTYPKSKSNNDPVNPSVPYRQMYRAAKAVRNDPDMQGGKTKYGGIDWKDYGAKGIKHVSPEQNPYFDDRNTLYVNKKNPSGPDTLQVHNFDLKNGQYLNSNKGPSVYNFKNELFDAIDPKAIDPGQRPVLPALKGISKPNVSVNYPTRQNVKIQPASTPQKRKWNPDTTSKGRIVTSSGNNYGRKGLGNPIWEKRQSMR
jgi:hypothetical protein